MSFLERREAEKATRDRVVARERAVQQQVQARQEEARLHARELEAQKEAEGQQACAYLQGSVAERMLGQLALTIEESNFSPAGRPFGNPTKSVTSLSWNHEHGPRHGTHHDGEFGYYYEWGRWKEIEIEADYKGTITVKGGGLLGSGSTTLTREQAKNSKLVEQALKKAYTHPQSKGYRDGKHN